MALVAKVAQVVSAQMITPTTIEVALEPSEPVSFQAGQYITVEVGRSPNDQPVRRSYSLANAPAPDARRLEVCVKMVPGGVGSTYLQSLKPGDQVSYLGPIGKFVVGKERAKEYVFIATGTGLSPCLSILLDELPRDRETPMRLYWGLRNEQDLYYHDRLQQLASEYPNFKLSICLSRPEGQWRGLCGRVTNFVTEEIQPQPGMQFYMAGNGAMCEDVKKLLMERGVAKQAIKCDVFF